MLRILSFLLVIQLWVPCQAQNPDIDLLRKIHVGRSVSMDPFFRFSTKTATITSISVPLVHLTIGKLSHDQTAWNNGLKSGLAIAGTMTLSTLLKYSIHRTRPYVKYPDIKALAVDHTPSFPSGHTSSVFCTATSLSLMYPKWYVIVPAYTWAASVGYSRMHLGMHYPSDVIVGAIIGTGISFLSFKVQRWIGNK